MYSARLKLPKTLSEQEITLLGEALSDVACAHSAMREDNKHRAPWTIEWILEDKPGSKDLLARVTLKAALEQISGIAITPKDFEITDIPETDWLAESYKQFQPFAVGPFFIYGSHYEGEISTDQIGLQIDAATAFGSGEHGTTEGCLQAMLDLKDQGICPWNVLDMGTGSGILAIAAWKLWKTPILAIDIDEESINVTSRHCKANQVQIGKSTITCEQGDGFKTPRVQKRGPYELIIANILAGPLIEMAAALRVVLDENGYVILSGMLVEQADGIQKTYEEQGLALKKRYDMGEWSTLVLQDTAA